MALPAGRYGVTKEQLRKIKRLPINTIGMITETKEGIAIVEDGPTASQLITAGRQFWHGGKLYSADVDISEDAAIVTSGEGKNASLMPSITDQLPGTDAEKANEVTIARVENGSSPTATISEGEQFYHSGILYTATADIATTDTITPNSNCRVSDSVTGQIASTQELIEDTVGYKVVNLFDEEYPDISPSSLHVVTLDVGAGTFTCKSDIPLNGSTANILFVAGDGSASTTTSANGVWKGQTRTFTAVDGKVSIKYRNEGGVDPNNYHVLVYNTDNMPVSEQKADNSVIGTVEDGTNPTRAYAVGEHFIRNGKFCTVTVAVTTSSTWTLGSNYVEGDVASILTDNTVAFTPNENYTVTLLENKAYGNVVCLSGEIKSSSEMVKGNNFDFGTITETKYRPAIGAYGIGVADVENTNVTCRMYVTSAGKLRARISNNIPANTDIQFNVTYII